MISPLNRTTGPQIIKFFDVCFKQGVLDSYDLGNDFYVKDFLESKREDWTFGVLGKDDNMDWQMFRFTIYWWARKNKLSTLAEDYIFQIRKKDHLWAFLPYCMRFYLLGIDEWLNYPNQTNIEYFRKKKKIHWNPNFPVSCISKSDIISYMHDFAYEYRKLPEDRREIGAHTLDGFCQSLYDLNRYAKGER